ncbi:unnamed protein product [Mytilus coruscus]|uniref:Endonuclease/exonuclease/phosphatase domain-containing protein n=1 Tax=Mytilus coruscus TaxID=42192 RepID=A0A6J8B2B8_MYTCO|nr:unnamed protein product [Mytilus coruscus]
MFYQIWTCSLDAAIHMRKSHFNRSRGKGGVAIAWKRFLTPSISEIPSGNNRIIATELKSPMKICIICRYMPTNNSGDSYPEYTECLDVISSLLSMYSVSHRIVIVGDYNSTLKPPRKYNKHDFLLQAFVHEMNLQSHRSEESTFFHHSGMSTSQIDYILHNATIAFLSDYKIHDQCHSNTSSHVPVSAKMNVKSKPTNKAIKSGYVSKFKIQWKDTDSETYHNHISNELSQHNIESHSIEESINFLCNCLKKAATVAVPSKIIKLKGPQFKASPTTLMLLKISKEKYQLWKSHGKKNYHLKTDKILAQRNLRKQLRKKQYLDRTQFYNKLMDNPSNDMFHKLIRRNRGSKNKDAICIMENDEHHYSTTDQTNSFSRYFEDLAVPKNNGYDPEFLDLCNIRHNMFDELCKQSSNEPQLGFQNICDAIQQLHSGKATDELGLAAEHFKNSPTTVTHFLTNCFNSIFNNHHIPDIFKSGIVTPVLKKREKSNANGQL